MFVLAADNPLRSRADVQALVRELVAPLAAYSSPSGARVRVGTSGAHFSQTCAELEGFARPLWGLAALAAGGGAFDAWERFRAGLCVGCDPKHPDYWGHADARDQRLVEMAPIASGLIMAREQLWEPLAEHDRRNILNWLSQINQRELPENNWLFFQVIVSCALERLGGDFDQAALERAFQKLDSFALGDGWYSDGHNKQRDYYVPFAIHYGALIYAKLRGERDPERAQRYRQAATRFAQDFMHWFAPNGAGLPFGRSLTYRFSQGAFWAALVFADLEALPWGQIKGLWMRHLRWWAKQPILQGDGTLSIGYGYANLNMAETYNSPSSPYWGMKIFLPLALPAEHPFWQAEEEELVFPEAVSHQPHAGMLLCHDRESQHTFALSCLQEAAWARHGAAKYAKFAYSTHFGFSVPSSEGSIAQIAPDSMLALSDDGQRYRVREGNLESRSQAELLYSRWTPWPDVTIETWLLPQLPWHIRVHHITSERALWSAEGGFCLPCGDERQHPHQIEVGESYALVETVGGWSGLRDLLGQRTGLIVRPDPNTNLLFPRSVLPVLQGYHEPGSYWLACAVLAQPAPYQQRDRWLQAPTRAHIPIRIPLPR